MSARALILGLSLAAALGFATYFNDQIIKQTSLIGNLFPIGVIGTVLFFALVLNPLLARIGPRLPFRPAELAVATAIALAACCWPGSGFLRYFATTLALPAHWQKTKQNWQAAEVMSYVPGGSPLIGLGHIQNWKALCEILQQPASPEAAAVFNQMSPSTQADVRALAAGDIPLPSRTRPIVEALNAALQRPGSVGSEASAEGGRGETVDRETLLERRSQLVSLFQGHLLPMPHGAGVLVLGGQANPAVTDTLVQGWQGKEPLSVADLPWNAWIPSLVLWVGFALLIGLGAFCLAIIVHPQWSRHELLAYPVARFVDEVFARRPESNSAVPAVTRHPLFWLGVGTMLAVHALNGIRAWFPGWPMFIPQQFDFKPFLALYGWIVTDWTSHSLFEPNFFFSIIAFSFFLSSEISLSLGISHMMWALFAWILASQGIKVQGAFNDSGSKNMLLFGAAAGFVGMILFVGRHYYASIARRAAGWLARGESADSSVWAARFFALFAGSAVLMLVNAGLDALIAGPTVALIYLMYLTIARMNAETGILLVQPGWMPMAIITGFVGAEAIGPTAYVLMALASVLLVIDPRESVLAYLVNGLRIAERTGEVPASRIAPWMAFSLVAVLPLALCVTLLLQYNRGVLGDAFRNSVSMMPLDKTAAMVSSLTADGTLARSVAVSEWERLSAAKLSGTAFLWAGLGASFVIAAAFARLRLPWWPIHPVLFLFWGTAGCSWFAWSFLAGWVVKASVVKVGGSAGYQAVKPLMIGIIAGELFAGLLWMSIGATYFFATGTIPRSYYVFPS